MKTFTIGEFKQKLPEILQQVAKGESVVLEKGRRNEKLAIFSPYIENQTEPRKLGIFAQRGKVQFKQWEMDADEFLGTD
ncbi:MAG: hypothetical protein L3J39_05900 [Verrucomicrobiales bacterium]|nr:hypothetical protein [Verrucomicrobiales bacterium]